MLRGSNLWSPPVCGSDWSNLAPSIAGMDPTTRSRHKLHQLNQMSQDLLAKMQDKNQVADRTLSADQVSR